MLNHVWARKADFTGALMHSIRIDKPIPTAGGFVNSINLGILTGVSFAGANISAIDYLDEKEPTFGTKDTIVFFDLEEDKKKAAIFSKKSRHEGRRAEQESETASSAFGSWSPYDSTDMVTGHLLSKFHSDLGLKGWPFED